MGISILIAILLYLILLLVAVICDGLEEERKNREKEERLAAIPDTMPLFNPKSKCSACTATNPYSRFVICWFQSSLGYSGEAIRKECRNCGHVWWEHTADFKKPEKIKIVEFNVKKEAQ